jgi:hypothetical protein
VSPKYQGERKLEYLGRGSVFRSPSTSRPGLFHLTVYMESGEVRCSCEGFCLQGHCWHIDTIPLCLSPSPQDNNKTCYFVKYHQGDHSWGPVDKEAEEKAHLEQVRKEEAAKAEAKERMYDPLRGLPE